MDSNRVAAAMYDVDWAAWGTWAAVMVALGIAVADKVYAYFQRKNETKILAILVLSEITATIIRLEDLQAEVTPPGLPEGFYSHILATDESLRKQFSVAGAGLKLPVLETALERLPNIKLEFASSLAELLAGIQSVRIGCADISHESHGATMKNAEQAVVHFRSFLSSALDAARKAQMMAGRLAM